MTTADPLAQLRQLAAAAEAHAREEHGHSLVPEDVEEVDRILRAEASRLTPDRRETLVACYGAWLGWLCVERWNARWAGLSEPAAPRLIILGLPFSPMDAIRRRLDDPSSLPLALLIPRIQGWIHEQTAARTVAPERNRKAWDALADDPRFAGGPTPADRDIARAGLDDWLRDEVLENRKLLCLGAGGGRQGPLHAMAGADVTVVDVSERMLDHDRRAGLKTLLASMDRLDGIPDASFDIVVQPVSSSYVADLDRVHAEVARVLKSGGLYIVQHKQPAHLQVLNEGDAYFIQVPYAEGAIVENSKAGHREPGTVEFVHTLDSLLGGLCRAGFTIEAFSEPPRGDFVGDHGTPGRRAAHLPPYLKIKARRS